METGEAPKGIVDTQKPAESTDTAPKPQDSQHHGGIGGFFRNLFGAHETTPPPTSTVDEHPTQITQNSAETQQIIPEPDQIQTTSEQIDSTPAPEVQAQSLQTDTPMEPEKEVVEFHPALNPLGNTKDSSLVANSTENSTHLSDELEKHEEEVQETQALEHTSRSRTWTEVGK